PGPRVTGLRSGALLVSGVAPGGGGRRGVAAGPVLPGVGVGLVPAALAVRHSGRGLRPPVLDRFLGGTLLGAGVLTRRVGTAGGVGDRGLHQGRLGVAGGVPGLLVLLAVGRLVVARRSLLLVVPLLVLLAVGRLVVARRSLLPTALRVGRLLLVVPLLVLLGVRRLVVARRSLLPTALRVGRLLLVIALLVLLAVGRLVVARRSLLPTGL